MKTKKTTTIEDLAGMVQRGFQDVTSRMALKKDVDAQFKAIDERFDRMDKRFDKMEHLILADHKRRIEKLEDELNDLKSLLLIK